MAKTPFNNHTMNVAMYYSNADVRCESMPIPEILPGEILMRIEKSGICGSDVMEWYRIHKVPLVLGHEVSGTVERVGKGVTKFKVGDKIVATHHVPCNKCVYCRSGHHTVCETLRKTNFHPGGFAQFVRLPKINVDFGTLKVPKNLDLEAATFAEPLGCVLRGQRLAGSTKGKNVLVLGSGMGGLLHIKYARHQKALSIAATDIDAFRLEMAKKSGGDIAINSTEDVAARLKDFWKGRLADLVIVCASADSVFTQALECVDRGGKILIFTAAKKDSSLPKSINDIFWRSEVSILSSYAASPDDLKQALNLLAKGNISVKDMVTHRLPLRETQQGFQLVVNPNRSMKIIIEPQK